MTNLVTTTPSRFAIIRPDQLPPLQLLQSISTEDIINNRMVKLKEIWASYDPPNDAQYDVENQEFDPLKIQAEVAAFFELLVRDRINQNTRGVTLAYAVGPALDAIASRYPNGGVPRKTKNATDPSLVWVGIGDQEPDELYRRRIWLSPNTLSLTGPGQGTYESYIYWALSAPQFIGQSNLRDASAWTIRNTGNVFLPIMADNYAPATVVEPATGDYVTTFNHQPVPTNDQVSAVFEYITEPNGARMGLTDVLYVQRPKVLQASINIGLWLFPGVDRSATVQAVVKAVNDLVAAVRWLGADVPMMALQGALAQPGVYTTDIKAPTGDLKVDSTACINFDQARIHYAGIAE
jgi:phage-related baseplate assembly protein